VRSGPGPAIRHIDILLGGCAWALWLRMQGIELFNHIDLEQVVIGSNALFFILKNSIESEF